MLDYHVQGVNDTRDPAQDGEQHVEPEMATQAVKLDEHSQWRQYDSHHYQADIAASYHTDGGYVAVSPGRRPQQQL